MQHFHPVDLLAHAPIAARVKRMLRGSSLVASPHHRRPHTRCFPVRYCRPVHEWCPVYRRESHASAHSRAVHLGSAPLELRAEGPRLSPPSRLRDAPDPTSLDRTKTSSRPDAVEKGVRPHRTDPATDIGFDGSLPWIGLGYRSPPAVRDLPDAEHDPLANSRGC